MIYKNRIELRMQSLSQKFRLALVSNAHYAPLVYDHLEAMHIRSFFSEVIISVEFGRRKPHPSIFEAALNRMKLTPDSVLHIGDSYRDDYCGAQNAGIRCLLVDPERRYSIDENSRIRNIDDVFERFRV